MRETKEENGDYINGQGAKVKEKKYKKRKNKNLGGETQDKEKMCPGKSDNFFHTSSTSKAALYSGRALTTTKHDSETERKRQEETSTFFFFSFCAQNFLFMLDFKEKEKRKTVTNGTFKSPPHFLKGVRKNEKGRENDLN